MTDPQIPTPKTGDTSGDKSPSFSPGARESASKRRERTVACGGDTLTPGDKISPQKLANASCAPVVTEDVAEGSEGGTKPDGPVEDAMPRWLRRYIDQGLPRKADSCVPPQAGFVPRILREAGMVVTPPVTRASEAHLKPLGQHELDEDAKIPEFLRRQGVTSLATHAQPIAIAREPSKGSPADQPSRFVPRDLRGVRAVTPPMTPAPPGPASVMPAATVAQPAMTVAPGSICPTCQGRVPARLSAAERQRAYRARKREQGKPVVP